MAKYWPSDLTHMLTYYIRHYPSRKWNSQVVMCSERGDHAVGKHQLIADYSMKYCLDDWILQYFTVQFSCNRTGIESFCSYIYKKLCSLIKVAMKQHHTVSFAGCNGYAWTISEMLTVQFRRRGKQSHLSSLLESWFPSFGLQIFLRLKKTTFAAINKLLPSHSNLSK